MIYRSNQAPKANLERIGMGHIAFDSFQMLITQPTLERITLVLSL